MSKKILIISGPTATGKTDLSLKLAKKFNGELISADSRQIYKGMDIGTGKDHPKDIQINLVDIINPDQLFSVAQFKKLALQKIEEIQNKNKLPIIVGGTGLYIDSIINSKTDTYHIKPHWFLRSILNHFSIKNLQKIYKFLDKTEYLKLNNSEVHNPHRLIRKIEIALFNKKILISKNKKSDLNFLHISLTAPSEFIYDKIDSRVSKRLEMGLLDEIKKLLKKYKWSSPGLNTLAYKEFKLYFKNPNPENLEKCTTVWKFDEHRYSRRQKTWFKNKPDTIFFDITKTKYRYNILEKVSKWYNNS